MNFETLQQRWQQQETRSQVRVDASLVLQEVRRNQHTLEIALFWRDFRETGAALLVTIIFLSRARDWTDYLGAVTAVGVGTCILVDRMMQRKKRPVQSDSLRCFVQRSLDQVRHQSWLLRNVLWWYMLPLTMPILSSLVVHDHGLTSWIVFMLVMVFVYWLNQKAVRDCFVPMEQELERVLAGIEEASEDESVITKPC